MADNPTAGQTGLDVLWREEDYLYPSAKFIGQANLTDPAVFDRFSLDNIPEAFHEYAELLTWDKYWEKTIDTSDPPFWKWFVGGKLNASYNCIDRHLAKHANKTAIHFVAEPESEQIQHITYQELWVRVNEFAALLKSMGLKAGDRVTIHLPMVPELPISMLACARLGVIHSVVFGGFSGKAAGERAADSQSKLLISMDGYWRAGKLLDHKEKADIAYKESEAEGHKLDAVLVWQRYEDKYSSPTALVKGRDQVVNERLKEFKGKRVKPVSMPADAPLFLMYTSGTTGRPKGMQHSIGGYLAYVAGTSKFIQDIHPEDVYWCMADIGWITGHSYIVYGPLALGASSVMYEGAPTTPDPGRPWRIAEELGVTIFHTSPTAVRSLRKVGPDEPAKYDYHFKHMTTVGEPIEPEVWRWYYNVVGKREAVIVDTWWQTETGGFLCSTTPALHRMKPGSAGPAVAGIHPIIYDDDGNVVPMGSGRAGNICIQNPWPGLAQTIWGQPERFVETYFARYCKDRKSTDWHDWPYMAGDAAMQAEDGYFRILGRIDDVINVAGHRLGTKEIESAALTVPEVAEAAVVPAKDEIKGVVPELYVALQPGLEASEALQEKIINAVATELGPIAKPRHVWIVPDMPKTRSGKIMRRVLRSLSDKGDAGDVTTLANPEVVETIRKQVQS
ncbi:MAG: acetate--CoA ligase [Deinococcales bacterium]